MKQKQILSNVALFGLLVVIGVLYAGAGAMKVSGDAQMIQRLSELGYGDTWRLFIGITELVGVAGLAWSRTRLSALICLWPYAIGGLALHIGHHHGIDRLLPAVIVAAGVPLAALLHVRRTCCSPEREPGAKQASLRTQFRWPCLKAG